MTQEAAAKKDTQKLQRAIVDGLEDVKAHDIVVFNTEHLSPLFERVIVASGTSNRQTKALAASVRDKVREQGFPKPRIEGEENGEWIIVDCGAAVAHIMQPAIRQYYHLEEIWGDKPVRLKFGAPKPTMQANEAAKFATPAKKAARPATKTAPAGKSAASRAKEAGQDKDRATAKKKDAAGTSRAGVAGKSRVPAKPAKAPAKKAPARSTVAARKPAGKTSKSPTRKK